MQYEFLKQFPKRMKNVGLYALLFANSSQKTIWRQYGFQNMDEQMNMVFAVLLYLMEQSLREEKCTMDDIGAYIDALNTSYFQKQMSFEDSRKLGDFIVNVVLSNEGRPMYFNGYDFEGRRYGQIPISYVANRIIYVDAELRRTSYFLTDDGYNLLLGTLEIESNLKLTIHEMIFKMHLEKQSYEKAADDIRNVFHMLRIQFQKIREAMGKIRRNALNYSVQDYQRLLEGDMESIRDTRSQFLEFREMVKTRTKELEEAHINIHKLDSAQEQKLASLKIIEYYLNRAIDEHQRILGSHFDLKALYTKELEKLSQMSSIQRFSLRNELFDQILADPQGLDRLDWFLRPLFLQAPQKIYNLNKAFEIQRPLRKKAETDSFEQMDFDESEWHKEQEALRLQKLEKYRSCLEFLLERLLERGQLSLEECQAETATAPEKLRAFIPNVEIFKEIMVELLRGREIELDALRRERSEFIQEAAQGFQLNEMLLNLLEKYEEGGMPKIRTLSASRTEDGAYVVFDGVTDEQGDCRAIRCSNVRFSVEY